MEKIVVIGSSGAGKSIFAKELGSMLNINVSHLDRLFWQSGWKEKSHSARMQILENLIREEERWIIDGNYLRFADIHVKAADTIIFLETPSLLCFWRLIERHRKYRKHSRDDIPEGCTDKLTGSHLFKVLIFPFQGKRIIKQTLLNYPYKHVVRLHSVKEITDFLAEHKQNVEPPVKEITGSLAEHKQVVEPQRVAAGSISGT